MEHSTAKKLILGSGLRLVALVVTVLVGLLLQPYVIHTLGDELYGIWTLATSFVGMFSLLDLGLNAAVARYVAATIGAKDYAGLNRYLNTGYYLFSGISCIALFIAGAAALYLFRCPDTMPHAKATAVVIIIMGAQFAITLPLQAIGGLLIGSLRYDIATTIGITFKILSSTAVFLTLYFGGGIIALAVTSFVCTIISRAVTNWFAHREVPQAEIALRHFDKKTIKELFSYSIFAFIAMISEMFRFQIPAFIVGRFIGVATVTHYNIATTLTSYFIMVISSLLGVLAPVFARQQANNDFPMIRKTLLFAIKISITIATFVAFGLIAWGHPFIERWMGKAYLDAYPWLVILVSGYLVALCQSPAVGMLYGLAKHSFHAIVNTTEAVLNFILGLILVQYYGCLGVAIAAMIPIVLLKLTVQPWFICRVVKESMFVYYWNILRTALACAAALILPSIATWYFAAPNYPALCLAGTVSVMLYFPVVFVVFTKAERDYVWNALWKKRGG
jgi:O-antigen/teichoic acid export membrane protein